MSRERRSVRAGDRTRPSPGRHVSAGSWVPLLLVVVAALGVRLVYVVQVLRVPVVLSIVQDSSHYESIAGEILSGNPFSPKALLLNPLYPFFLASIYSLFGVSAAGPLLAQAVFDVATCALVYLIAARAFDRRTALLSAVLYALYRQAVFFSGLLLAETLVTFFLVLAVSLVQRGEQDRRSGMLFPAGLALALAWLGRPNLVLVAVAVPTWLLVRTWRVGTLRNGLASIGLFLAAFALVAGAVAVRNSRIPGGAYFSSLGGLNFYIGNNPGSNGYFTLPPGIDDSPIEIVTTSIALASQRAGRPLTAGEASSYWFAQGLDYLASHPLQAGALYVRKLMLFWRAEENDPNVDFAEITGFVPVLRAPLVPFGLISPLAMVGLLWVAVRGPRPGLLLTVTAVSVASVLTFFVTSRYRLPIVPLLAMFAAVGMLTTVQTIRSGTPRRRVAWASGLVLLVALTNYAFPSLVPHTSAVDSAFNVGVAYYRAGDLPHTREKMREVTTKQPGNAEAQFLLGLACINDSARSSDLVQEAARAFSRAAALDPHNPDYLLNLGKIDVLTGQYEAALVPLRALTEIDATKSEPRYRMGIALYRLGRHPEAEEQLLAASWLDPRNAEVFYALGEVYAAEGHEDQATSMWSRALTLNPAHRQALSRLHAAGGDPAPARAP
jgi:Flp pilus assembly protein TadD/4-amino-4-deoxy-L-arabinose transferase-like glycosyltransferase